MKWLTTAWQLARDVLLTGAGLTLIMLQEFAVHPSPELIGAGLFLLTPAGIQHAVTVYLSAQSPPPPGAPPSSPPSPGELPSPSGSSPSGATGERAR